MDRTVTLTHTHYTFGQATAKTTLGPNRPELQFTRSPVDDIARRSLRTCETCGGPRNPDDPIPIRGRTNCRGCGFVRSPGTRCLPVYYQSVRRDQAALEAMEDGAIQ